jgi:D-alanine-D-alanine ligase
MKAAEVIEHARLEHGRAPRAAREVHLMARPCDEPLFSIDRNGPGERGGDGALVQSMGLDVVFPVLHGPYGEDGTVQGLLELANLPYVGCGVLASAVGMDKAMMKVVFAQHGLPQVDHAVILRSEWQRNRAGVRSGLLARLPAPLFVKPANLGSSVGISKVRDAGELDAAMDLAAGFDRKIVVEAGVPNAREIECAVLGNDAPEASVAGEVVPSREFYDYEAKYIDEGSKTIIPADLGAAQLAEVQRLSKAAFTAIDGSGLARVDFLLGRDDGRLFLNEVNTLPGFTTISMFSKLWEASGVPYPALIDRLIELALERHAAKQQLRTSVL